MLTKGTSFVQILMGKSFHDAAVWLIGVVCPGQPAYGTNSTAVLGLMGMV